MDKAPCIPHGGRIAGSEFTLTPVDAGTRLSLRLRLDGNASRNAAITGLLELRISQCIIEEGVTTARLGPDEWLVLGPEADKQRLAQQVEAALEGQICSLVDISHRNTSVLVSGTRAREVLNGGCPLDLHDSVFPPFTATRTLFGKAELVLLRPDVEFSYRVECARSFAPYVHGLLADVSYEFRA